MCNLDTIGVVYIDSPQKSTGIVGMVSPHYESTPDLIETIVDGLWGLFTKSSESNTYRITKLGDVVYNGMYFWGDWYIKVSVCFFELMYVADIIWP